MSTNKTQNYNLHSWLPQDEFHVSEINENFTKLDAELALETEALQDTFADEVGELNTALQQKLEVVCGQYEGTGESTMSFELGVTPKAVLICLNGGAVGDSSNAYAAIGAPGLDGPIVCTATGFQLVSFTYSRLTYKRTFFYIVLY